MLNLIVDIMPQVLKAVPCAENDRCRPCLNSSGQNTLEQSSQRWGK